MMAHAFLRDWDMHKRMVLLVDNEPLVLASIGSYLERNHMQVTTATSGESALGLFRTKPFDLVITDLAMDGIDGIELLAEIKKINMDSSVFILTGQGNMNSAIEALRLGADDYLLKPCDAEELILRMQRCFTKQDALKKIKIYEKFLPICMYCKKIRDDTGTRHGDGKWLQPEEYMRRRGGVKLSHGCCPACYEEHKNDWMKE